MTNSLRRIPKGGRRCPGFWRTIRRPESLSSPAWLSRISAPLRSGSAGQAGGCSCGGGVLTKPRACRGNRKTVITGLECAEVVITQDVYADTVTNAYADIVLPAAQWVESEGVMVNSERTLTLNQRAVQPVGQARPD